MAVSKLFYTVFLYPIEPCERGNKEFYFRVHFLEPVGYEINLDNKLIDHPAQEQQD